LTNFRALQDNLLEYVGIINPIKSLTEICLGFDNCSWTRYDHF